VKGERIGLSFHLAWKRLWGLRKGVTKGEGDREKKRVVSTLTKRRDFPKTEEDADGWVGSRKEVRSTTHLMMEERDCLGIPGEKNQGKRPVGQNRLSSYSLHDRAMKEKKNEEKTFIHLRKPDAIRQVKCQCEGGKKSEGKSHRLTFFASVSAGKKGETKYVRHSFRCCKTSMSVQQDEDANKTITMLYSIRQSPREESAEGLGVSRTRVKFMSTRKGERRKGERWETNRRILVKIPRKSTHGKSH